MQLGSARLSDIPGYQTKPTMI